MSLHEFAGSSGSGDLPTINRCANQLLLYAFILLNIPPTTDEPFYFVLETLVGKREWKKLLHSFKYQQIPTGIDFSSDLFHFLAQPGNEHS